MKFNKIKQRGQVLALYGLLIPFLLLFVGVGLDLGWYYLNVSRLQNAADAAALAGATALVKKDLFTESEVGAGKSKDAAFVDYYTVQLASNQLPADFLDYEDVFSTTFGSTALANGELRNYKTEAEAKPTLEKGRQLAEKYARLNLEDTTTVSESDDWKTLSATDAWNKSANAEDRKVTGTIDLKYKEVDGKNDVYGQLYYVVSLNEKIRHFLLPGWFEPMDAPVRAVVLLQPHDDGLITPMEYLERTMVIDNWEYTSRYLKETGGQISGGKWNHYQAGRGSNTNYGIRYTSGNAYRNESVVVKTSEKKNSSTNVITSADGSSGVKTVANGNKWYSTSEVDSINIDFRAEIIKLFSTDWDLGQTLTGATYKFAEGWTATDGADKRILFNTEFDEAFDTRDTSKIADPLWVRIESEPIIKQINKDGNTVKNYNSVRQITLNFNDDNTGIATNADGEKYYTKRPYVIFYTGPENIDYKTDDNGVLIRHSQPVVLNLNENLNAIIYMPDSPVIINGNGNALRGFVIAKCFLQSVTSEEMTGNKTITLYDGFNAPTNFTGNYTEGTDGNGYTVYFKPDELSTKEQVEAAYPNATITTDEKGNVTVKEVIQAPQYPIISFTKELYENCTTLADYFTRTAEHINSTYTKEKYMAFSGLSESQISMIRFPDENEVLRNGKGIITHNYGNFTDITIPVATADLLNEDPDPEALTKDNKYVKVLRKIVVDGEEAFEEKYIAKSKLPHMRVKRNSDFPYACIYDLKTGLGWNRESNFVGVKPMDNTSTTADSSIVFTNSSNYWGDVWVIEEQLLTQTCKNEYIASKLEFAEKDGFTYFMRKSEIAALPKEPQTIAKYHKITYEEDGKEKTVYAKDGAGLYYTKVNNNTNHPENDNYIIVDETGNMLTKPITSPNIVDENTPQRFSDYWSETYTREPKDPAEIPRDRGQILNGRYVGRSQSRLNKDYRIPDLERVYQESVFNLNAAKSMYSYFGIEELKRVNYIYLNVDEINQKVHNDETEIYNWEVDDMFYTTKRAKWID